MQSANAPKCTYRSFVVEHFDAAFECSASLDDVDRRIEGLPDEAFALDRGVCGSSIVRLSGALWVTTSSVYVRSPGASDAPAVLPLSDEAPRYRNSHRRESSSVGPRARIPMPLRFDLEKCLERYGYDAVVLLRIEMSEDLVDRNVESVS